MLKTKNLTFVIVVKVVANFSHIKFDNNQKYSHVIQLPFLNISSKKDV